MSYTLKISQLAEADLADAKNWYRSLRPGLEANLALCVEEALDRMLDNPDAFPLVSDRVRRALVRRVPYQVIFRVQKHRIEIEAIFHARRDPKRWQTRIS